MPGVNEVTLKYMGKNYLTKSQQNTPKRESCALFLEYTVFSGLILGLRPANERRRYKVTPSPIGWTQT